MYILILNTKNNNNNNNFYIINYSKLVVISMYN